MRYRWPNGAQCAVALSFDVDAESGYVYRSPKEAASQLDQMEERRFGVRTGVYRILRLLEKYELPATFFVPGYTIEHHTRAIEAIHAAGYEMACHGNVHETLDTLDEAAERRILTEQLDIYQKHLGIRPARPLIHGCIVSTNAPFSWYIPWNSCVHRRITRSGSAMALVLP
jgi:peptidoglycan/xylan/chitin deacetylase (PgdA/CDA1 family)